MEPKQEKRPFTGVDYRQFADKGDRTPNHYLAHTMMGVFIVNVLLSTANEVGVFYVDKPLMRTSTIISMFLAVSATFLGLNKRTDSKKITKYLMMTLILIDLLVINVILNQYTALTLLFPLILSILYHRMSVSAYALAGSLLVAIAAPPLSYLLGTFEPAFPLFLLNAAGLNVEVVGELANFDQGLYMRLLMLFISLPECMMLGISCIVVISMIRVGEEAQQYRVNVTNAIADLERDFTGSYVRRAFFYQIEDWMKRYPEIDYDLYLADLHNFTGISRMYGPAAMESVLKSAAAAIRAACPDGLVGRYGIDQFALLLEHGDNVADVIQKLETEIAKIKDPGIRMNFGVCPKISHDRPIAESCHLAEGALATIKRRYEEAYVVFDEKMQADFEKRRVIEDSMLESVENDRFVVWYQPKHDAKTRKVIGAEALVRWNHPKYGLLFPGEFVDIFEENGFLPKLDVYMIDKICSNIRNWVDRGETPVPVSINWSRSAFSSYDCYQIAKNSLEKYGLPPELLHFEVTESAFVENPTRMKEQLLKCREAGIHVELDDFGSGYSSLSSLADMPLDIIKIDRSLVQGVHNEKGLRMLRTCVDLANNYGFRTLCEGVETEEELEIVKDAGVELIQGYYFSKPLPIPQFEAYLKEKM